jgi:hypothetical protein
VVPIADWIRAGSSVLALAIVFAGWYRLVYNVWPGLGASARVHWCGRNYEYFGAPAQSWRQISSQAPWPIHTVWPVPAAWVVTPGVGAIVKTCGIKIVYAASG